MSTEPRDDPFELAREALAAYVARDAARFAVLAAPDAAEGAFTYASELASARVEGLFWLGHDRHIAAVLDCGESAPAAFYYLRIVEGPDGFGVAELTRGSPALGPAVSG